MKYRPLGDRIIVKPEPQDEATKSGILIADSAKTPVMRGVIQSISVDVPLTVKVGDTVVFNRHNVTVIEEDSFLLHESDILAIL